MTDLHLAVLVYFTINVVICVATLYVGIVQKGDRVSGPLLVVMMAMLLLFGLPSAMYVYVREKRG